uniref:Uncharacterized protein n=1 Tax=Sphaerodactylus townsendi TaxID=933632 RepID=A0ACB8EWV7_9SAUR
MRAQAYRSRAQQISIAILRLQRLVTSVVVWSLPGWCLVGLQTLKPQSKEEGGVQEGTGLDRNGSRSNIFCALSSNARQYRDQTRWVLYMHNHMHPIPANDESLNFIGSALP